MNWHDLKFFLALATHGNLTQAGQKLGVSHATVARRIQTLEEALDARLFDKTPLGYEITEFGTLLLEPAQEMMHQTLRIDRLRSAWDDAPTGVVRLATPTFLGPAIAMAAAREIHDKWPGILLNVLESQKTVRLEHHEADLAIRISLSDNVNAPQSLLVRRLGGLPWALFGSPQFAEQYKLRYPVENLNGVPLVLYSDEAPGKPGTDWIKTRVAKPMVTACSNSAQSVCGGIRNHLGAGVLPILLGKANDLVQLSPTIETYNAHLLVHPDLRHSPRVRVVAEFLVEYLQRNQIFD